MSQVTETELSPSLMQTMPEQTEPFPIGFSVEHFTGPEVNAVWSEARVWIEDSTSRSGGKYTADDVRAACEMGDQQLWMVWWDGVLKAVATTQLWRFPGKSVCKIDIVTGDGMKFWAPLRTIIEDWARNQGCESMWALARPGWERVAPDYRKTHVLLEKEL